MSETESWRYQLATAPGQLFANDAYPDRLLGELKEVSDYSQEIGIYLTLMTLPTHVDLQTRREDFVIEDECWRSIDAIRSLACVSTLESDDLPWTTYRE